MRHRARRVWLLIVELIRDEDGMTPPPDQPGLLLVILLLVAASVLYGLRERIRPALVAAEGKGVLLWCVVLIGATAVATGIAAYRRRDSIRRAARHVRECLVAEESGAEDG